MAQRVKRSISLPPDLAEDIDKEAAMEGTTFSAWLAAAAAHHLKLAVARRVMAEWEAENGAFTEEELAEARARVDRMLAPEKEKPSRRKSA
jgi:hypothetical protein